MRVCSIEVLLGERIIDKRFFNNSLSLFGSELMPKSSENLHPKDGNKGKLSFFISTLFGGLIRKPNPAEFAEWAGPCDHGALDRCLVPKGLKNWRHRADSNRR